MTPQPAAASSAKGDLDFEKWYVSGLPLPLIAACAACQKGVKRAHLVDARHDGGLLLELYSRDGVGTMLSADFYEVCYIQCVTKISKSTQCRSWHHAVFDMGLISSVLQRSAKASNDMRLSAGFHDVCVPSRVSDGQNRLTMA